jgi:transposase
MESHQLHLPVRAGGRAVVGIDIGKRHHAAVAVSHQGDKLASIASFQNTREGVDMLQALVLDTAGTPPQILFAMEATGHYWMPLYHELVRRGYRGAVLNPIQTNGEARTRIRKTKTDKRDAEGIARFILTGKAKAARIPDEATLELRILTRRLLQLTQMRGDVERAAQSLSDRIFPEYAECMSKPFLHSGRTLIKEIGLIPAHIAAQPDAVRDTLRRASRGRLSAETIDGLLENAAESIGIGYAETVINEELHSSMELIENIEDQICCLDSIIASLMDYRDSPLPSLGIGLSLAAAIHAESDPASDFPSARQYAAYAGLEPTTFESGQMQGTRAHISKRGSPHLRRALYMAAFVCYRRHEYFARTYRRFRKKGHTHNSALIVVARRLALVVWKMLVENRPFSKRPPKKK